VHQTSCGRYTLLVAKLGVPIVSPFTVQWELERWKVGIMELVRRSLKSQRKEYNLMKV
jgi:hypothetical protein